MLHRDQCIGRIIMPELTALQPRFLSTPLAAEFASLPSSDLLPIFSNTPARVLATSRLRPLDNIDLNNFTDVNTTVANLNLKNNEVHSALKIIAENNSSKEAVNFSKAMINSWQTGSDALSQSKEMANWARVGKKKDRAIVCKAFIETKQTDFLMHNIGGMEKNDARKFMKDFLSNGGTSKDAYEWLAGAGNFLHKNNLSEPQTDGFWDFITDVASDFVDWAWGAITTVADAIKAAAENLGRAIGEIVNWSIGELSNVVRSLIVAGESVATILSAAVGEGITALKKFVRAVISAGQSILSVVRWVGTKASNIIRNTVRALLAAGKNVLQITKSVIKLASSAVRKIVQALIDLGHDVDDMVRAAINATATRVKNLVDALLRAGQQVLEILRETLSEATAAINNVVKALFDLGKTIGQLILTSVRNLGNPFLEKVLDAMMNAGKTLSNIIHTTIQVAVGSVRKLVRALSRVGQSIQDILNVVRTATSSILNRVMRGLQAAGKTISNILTDVVRYVGGRLKNMIIALYEVFRDAAAVLIKFARRGRDVIRTVLEGLFVAGLRFASSIALILQNVVSEFHKDFFAGLVALGHAVVDIMGEALKLAGGLAALAFTAILELFGGHRPLTAEEKEAARAIFGWSINLDRIKIANASLPADFILKVNGGRPFTTMHIINFASTDVVGLRTLIHEMTHTWQGIEAGPVYMVESLHDQFTLGDNAYTITKQMLQDNNGNFARFGREQQARLVDMYYAYKYGDLKDDNEASDWITDLSPYARQVYRDRFGISRPDFNFSSDLGTPISIGPVDPIVFTPIRFHP